jgi:hypothetical protein
MPSGVLFIDLDDDDDDDYDDDDDDDTVATPAGLGIFLFTTASRTALGPTQLPIQWVPGSLSLG